MIAVLHSWGQNLCLHPHLHCLVPNGAFIPELNRWVYPKRKHFLFPVRVMSKMFRGKFIQLLEQDYRQKRITWNLADWSELLSNLHHAGFNVFSKMGFPGPDHIIQYLGRYSHRVAITNQRITGVSEQKVSFRYKDYRDGKQKVLELTPKEFTHRFLLHVLPKRFAKIRHFGILANRDKTIKIERILHLFERRRKPKPRNNAQSLQTGNLPVIRYPCPVCQKGQLIPVEELTTITHTRGSP
jgi:hypothetical protein